MILNLNISSNKADNKLVNYKLLGTCSRMLLGSVFMICPASILRLLDTYQSGK